MKEDINLRPYFSLLFLKWKLIIIITTIMSLFAFGINSFMSVPTYTATAIVAVIESRDKIEIDPSIEGVRANQPLAAFPELALSDEVVSNLIYRLSMQNSLSITEFRKSLESESGADKSLIILTAKSDTPENAAHIANVWAETFIERANRLYVGQNEEQVAFFEEQLAAAELDLNNAEHNLNDFLAVNQTQIISNTLAVYEQQYTDLLFRQFQIGNLLENTRALREQTMNQPTAASISYVDQLTFLQLQLQTFADDLTSSSMLTLNTQENLTTKNRSDQIELLDGLIRTLEEKSARTISSLTELEPQILSLQQEANMIFSELTHLENGLQIAQQTYSALAYQVSEERIISQDTSSGFQLVSPAVIPKESVSNRVLATVMGGFVGFMVAASGIIINDWWERTK